MIFDALVVGWVCVSVVVATVVISSARVAIHRSFASGMATVGAVAAVHVWPSGAALCIVGVVLATSILGLASLIEHRSTRVGGRPGSHRSVTGA